MMPLFFVLFCVLLVRVAMLPGAIDGYAYLFMPRWEALANPQTWVLALGQAFFGLSLCRRRHAGIRQLPEERRERGLVGAQRRGVQHAGRGFVGHGGGAGRVRIRSRHPGRPPLLFIVLPQVFEEMPFGGLFCFVFSWP